MGIIFIIGGMFVLIKMVLIPLIQYYRSDEMVEATIEAIEECKLVIEGEQLYNPICSYKYQGGMYRCKVNYTVPESELRIGKKIIININPECPEEPCKIDDKNKEHMLIIGGASIIAVIFGFIYLGATDFYDNIERATTKNLGSDMQSKEIDASQEYLNRSNKFEVNGTMFYLPTEFSLVEQGELYIYETRENNVYQSAVFQIEDNEETVKDMIKIIDEHIDENKEIVSEVENVKINNNKLKKFKAKNIADGKIMDVAYGANNEKMVYIQYYCSDESVNIFDDMLKSVKF